MKIMFDYTNHRGETYERVVVPEMIEYIKEPGYGYPPGWFLTGFDVIKDARRSFFLNNIKIPEGMRHFRLLPIENGGKK